MIKNILLLLGTTLALIFTSCSSDDCTSADWAGTYSLTSEAECILDENTTITADPTIVVSEGSTDGTVIIDGEELTIDQDD